MKLGPAVQHGNNWLKVKHGQDKFWKPSPYLSSTLYATVHRLLK